MRAPAPTGRIGPVPEGQLPATRDTGASIERSTAAADASHPLPRATRSSALGVMMGVRMATPWCGIVMPTRPPSMRTVRRPAHGRVARPGNLEVPPTGDLRVADDRFG